MSKFEVGDRAEVIGRSEEWTPDWPDYIGQIVTILEPLQTLYNAKSGRRVSAYVVDIRADTPRAVIAFEPHNLKSLDDGEEASWEQVEKITAWRPKELVHVETS